MVEFTLKSYWIHAKPVYIRLIRVHVHLDNVKHNDGWRGFYGFVYICYSKQPSVLHGSNKFARGNHTSLKVNLFALLRKSVKSNLKESQK